MQAGRVLFQSLLWRGLYYVTAFVINILIARHFQASLSGTIYYISSIYALILLFSSLGLESGIIYFSAKAEMPASKLFSFSIVWSLVIAFLVFSMISFFLKGGYKALSGPLLLFSSVSFIAGNLLTTYCSGFFYAKNNFFVPNIINIIITITLIVLLPYGGKSIIPSITDDNYFYVYFGSFLLQGICVTVLAGSTYVKNGFLKIITLTEFKFLFRYCAMAFAGNIIYFLLYRIDYLFVEEYCTPGQLGNYIQVSKLVHLFVIIPSILASAVFPIAASGKQQGIEGLLTLLSRTIFFIYLLICIFLMLTGKWLFPFVFGESFSEMYQPFLFLVPGILSLSGLFTLTAYFAGVNRIRTNIIGSVYALIVIVAGDMIFIPFFGINAAALISSIGYMVYQGYIIYAFKEEFKITLRQFYLVKPSDFQRIKKSISLSAGTSSG